MSETARPTPTYSVVVPVYKNSDSLQAVVERLEWLQDQLDAPLEAVFVVDGSPDDSAAVLRALLPASTISSQLVLLARNFGSFAAIRAGFLSAKGEYIAAMAADLQEPVELVLKFFVELRSGDWDVAVGTRLNRQDPVVARSFSAVYWAVYRKVVQREMPAGGVDIFACTRQVASNLKDMGESSSSLVGLVFWMGFRRIEVPYTRVERVHGKSAWTFKKKLAYLADSVFSFTSLPISIILGLGILGTAVSLVAALVVFFSWLGGAIVVPGYSALMLVLLFSTGSLLFALGIVGTYVWRTFENTKQRPGSIVMKHEVFN